MKTRINTKKAIIAGLIVIVLDMILGNLLYMNPWVSGLYAQYEGHPSTKSMDYFGGLGYWLGLTFLFGIVFTVLIIGLYLLLYPSLPGSGWQKGLFYGLMVGVIKAVPEAFNQWMLFDYPTILIVMQLLNTLLGLTIFGLILAVVFDKLQVIQEVKYE
jgi:hypothetical protein